MNNKQSLSNILIVLLTIAVASSTLAQTHLTLGSEEEEGDAMLLRPRQIEEGPDGNLYVLDAGDSCIKVYSTNGEYLRKLAGSGEGPGEFQRTDGVKFGFTTNDKLFFTEYFGGHRWITILELNGDLIQTLEPQFEGRFGVEAAKSLEDGGFLVQVAYLSPAYASNNYFLSDVKVSLVQIDYKGVIVQEVVQETHPSTISISPNGGDSNLPFVPGFSWALLPDNTIVWGNGQNPRLSVFDFAGQKVREFDTKLPGPEKVTSDDLKNWCKHRKEFLEERNPSWWNRFGRVVEEYKKSLFDKPIFGSISLAPEQHLLIGGRWDSETDQRTYWMFNPQGEMVTSVTTDISFLRISENHLLYFSTNEDGSTSANAVKWSGAVGESLNFVPKICDK